MSVNMRNPESKHIEKPARKSTTQRIPRQRSRRFRSWGKSSKTAARTTSHWADTVEMALGKNKTLNYIQDL